MIYPDIVQGSDEWHALRVGSIGGTSIEALLATVKSGEAAGRKNLRAELICQRLTGIRNDFSPTQAMKDGIEREPQARSLYKVITGYAIQEIGLATHPRIAGSHASPDGLVNDDGCLEIKCPIPATHLETLKDASKIKRGYRLQMQHEMACCERQWCDFVSYSPDFPPEMQVSIQRIERDQSSIDEIESELIQMLSEVACECDALTQQFKLDEVA